MSAAAAVAATPAARRRDPLPWLVFPAFALVPLAAMATGDSFLTVSATRIVIFAMAALAVDLVLGYGGLVSFGFSAFFGIGAYAVGIASVHGANDIAVSFPIAMAAAGLFALVTGAISLRTRGVYFIMITLAFGQMIYFTATSLSAYGGDDGLTIWTSPTWFGTGAFGDPVAFYYFALVLLGAVYLILRRIVESRFGRVLDGCRQSPLRMQAIGIEPIRYQLVAYVIAGMVGGLAGALYADHTEFVSPSAMSWQRSGELIVMVVLGGLGSLHGAIIGAAAYLVLEEVLSPVTEHWRMIFGPLIILAVLFARGGFTAFVDRLLGRGP